MSELDLPKRPKLFYRGTEIAGYIVYNTKFIEKNGDLVCEYCEKGLSNKYKSIVEGFKYCPYCKLPIRVEEKDPED